MQCPPFEVEINPNKDCQNSKCYEVSFAIEVSKFRFISLKRLNHSKNFWQLWILSTLITFQTLLQCSSLKPELLQEFHCYKILLHCRSGNIEQMTDGIPMTVQSFKLQQFRGISNSRPSPGSHGNSDVKPPKAKVVFRWVIFLALDFRCILPPMVHPIIVGVSGWTGYFQPTMWEFGGLPLGKIGASRLVLAHSRCSPSKGGSNLRRRSNFHIARFRDYK